MQTKSPDFGLFWQNGLKIRLLHIFSILASGIWIPTVQYPSEYRTTPVFIQPWWLSGIMKWFGIQMDWLCDYHSYVA